jgi:hypothetical protein
VSALDVICGTLAVLIVVGMVYVGVISERIIRTTRRRS